MIETNHPHASYDRGRAADADSVAADGAGQRRSPRPAPFRRRRRAPERTVLAAGLLGGLLYVFVTPPFQVPDEPGHFRSAYQIGSREPVVRRGGVAGVEEPASLEELMRLCLAGAPDAPPARLPAGTLRAAARIPLAPQRRVFLPLSALSPYTAAPYLPQAAGAAVGAALALPPLWTLYLARLCNLAASLALTWWAVRLVPLCRWALALLALMPMAMFLRGSVSADALTGAGAMLLAGAACALACTPRKEAAAAAGTPPDGRPSTREATAALLVGALVVATAKPGYWLLNGLVLLIPRRRLGPARRWAALAAAVLAVTVLGVLGSLWVARNYFDRFPHPPGVQPYRQAMAVAAHPLHFASLALTDYAVHLPRYAVGFVGNFGWLDTPLPIAVLVPFALLLLALALTGGEPDAALAPPQRLLLAAVLAAGLAFISFSQYVSWTPLGAGFIAGPQGRYFFPLAPLGMLLLCRSGRGARRAVRREQPPGTELPAPFANAPNDGTDGTDASGASGASSANDARRDRLLAAAAAAFNLAALVHIWVRYHGW